MASQILRRLTVHGGKLAGQRLPLLPAQLGIDLLPALGLLDVGGGDDQDGRRRVVPAALGRSPDDIHQGADAVPQPLRGRVEAGVEIVGPQHDDHQV